MSTLLTPFQTWKLLTKKVDRSAHPLPQPSPVVTGWKKMLANGGVFIAFSLMLSLMLFFLVVINWPFYMAHTAKKSIDQIPTMSWNSDKNWRGLKKILKGEMNEGLENPKLMVERNSSSDAGDSMSPGLLSQMESIVEDNLVDGHPQIDITQYSVAVVAHPKFKKETDQLFRDMGMNVVSYPCTSCIVLSRSSNTWKVNVLGISENHEALVQLLSARLFIAVHEKMSDFDVKPLADPNIVIQKDQVFPSVHAVTNYLFSSFINIFAIVLWWLLVSGSGWLGYEWDLRRSRGHLEFLILVKQPIWVLYGAQIFKVLKFSMLAITAGMILAACWQLPVHWGLMAALWVSAPFVIVFFSLWSLLATVMFHHAQGRMMARLLLSPLPFCLMLAIRLTVMWGAYKAATPLLAWDTFHNIQAYWPLLLLAPLILASLIAVLFHLINWRLGGRRQGLRRIV